MGQQDTWDLVDELQGAVKEIIRADCIKFPRALMEESMNWANIVLVLFMDGDGPTSCAAAYHMTERIGTMG